MGQRLIDANRLLKHYQDHDLISTHTIWNAPTVDAISKKDLCKTVNKIIKCSLGKWYVGRTDGELEEVVLLEDVLKILTDLLNEKNRSR